MLCCEPITLRYSDGYPAFARLWLPDDPWGAVLYLHGIQSHGQWFEGSARHLAEAGLAVLLPDRRGSGRNEIDRGHSPSVRRWLRDCSECLDELHVRTGLNRFQVVGVSWGGKLALGLYRFAPERVAGLSLVAPGLFPRVDLTLGKKFLVGLSALTGGRGLFDIPLNEPELFTATPKWRRFLLDDPLRLRQVTASFLICSRRLDRYVLGMTARRGARGEGQGAQGGREKGAERPADSESSRGGTAAENRGHEKRGEDSLDSDSRRSGGAFVSARLGCPLRVFLAGIDPIIHNEQTRDFVRRLGWRDRGIIEYAGAHHTLEFEPKPDQYYADLLASTGSRIELPVFSCQSSVPGGQYGADGLSCLID